MSQASPPDVTTLINRPPRSVEFLSFKDIEEQYPNTAKASTLSVWACTHRYNFHQLITKVGKKSVVRRDRWEAFLESRTACNAAPKLASA